MADVKNRKEIRIFCDFETDTALVRIFKFRNYSWSGGKTYEIERVSDRLTELSSLIDKYRDAKHEGKKLTSRSEILWNNKSEVATSYELDMSIKEKQNDS